MDNALQSLTNTLDAINSRQAAARKRARKGVDATPFTSAVLNRERLEIYTYIRDADPQTEANLFWYPPLPQSASGSRTTPSSSSQRTAHAASGRANGAANITDDANEADLLLAPRLPEPRHVAPPTPLRNANVSSKQAYHQSQHDQSIDPRVLLLAAQRLNDTCGKGSRTRKHIKGLMKTHASLNQSIKSYEQQIRQSEAELRATAEGRSIGASPLSGFNSDGHHADDITSATGQIHTHLSEVEESIRKEELEILALEEMIAELRQARSDWQKQELERQQRVAAAAESSRILQQQEQMLHHVPPPASLARVEHPDATVRENTEEASLVAADGDDDDDDQDIPNNTLELTQQEEDREQAQQLTHASEPHFLDDQQVEPDTSVDRGYQEVSSSSHSVDDATDLTVQQPRDSVPHDDREEMAAPSAATNSIDVTEEPTVDSRGTAPSHLLTATRQSSEELERVTRKVWEIFGDALRSVAPERESADYLDTLDILRLLMAGGERPNAADYSVGSVQTSSTLSTAVSEASTGVSAQLTPEVLMTAFVIFQMLVSEEPHRMNIDDLKVRGHEWWSTLGTQVWLHAQSHDNHDVPSRIEAFEDGQNLARKATYGMISKQLFAIKRQKGVGLVGFA